MPSFSELKPFVEAHRRILGPGVRAAAFAWVVLATIAALMVARGGTSFTRVAALALLGGGLVSAVILWLGVRRRVSSPDRLLAAVVLPVMPEVGGRLLRAQRLRAAPPPGQSQELIALHYERSLQAVDLQAIEARLAEHARLFRRFAVVCFAFVLLVVAFAPRRPFEGLNTLLAQEHRAPVPMVWLDGLQVSAQPPAYLGQPALQLRMQTGLALPEGTIITFRGLPLARGRELVVTDEQREVAFVDDGSGLVVARWELDRAAVLRVAARFGEVRIFEPTRLELFAVEDRPPSVHLAGAPRELELAALERLQLDWTATDDHSLVQVELVLRSAGREERRPLERYPGDQRSGVGGHVLYNSDPFFRRLFLPATVVIEARDNDPRQGNKWGRSEAFTVHPPSVGAPALERYRALSAVLDKWVGALALRAHQESLSGEPSRAAATAFREAVVSAKSATSAALSATYGGLEVPKGWFAFAKAQIETFDRASLRRSEGLKAIEDLVLALDRAVQTLAEGDARSVSKQLGDVAEEGALAARLGQSFEQREAGAERLELALAVLDQGIRELAQLGALGRDIGSVARGDMGRVLAARAQADLFHVELALLHMAARLHRPNPSFGSKGGGGGVESGPGMSGGSGGDAQGESSGAQTEFDKLMGELQRLAQEHAESMGRTTSALSGAEKQVNIEGLQEEASRRAEQLRRAILPLPPPGAPPGTGEAAAALTREHAGAMAHELGRLGFAEALESGRRGVGAAEAALRSGALTPYQRANVEEAQRALREQMAWAEQMAEEVRRQTQVAAEEELQQVAQLEAELSDRAKRLSTPGDDGRTLPSEAADRLRQAQALMEEAARRLRAGEGASGLDAQRKAQRLLEESDTGESQAGDGDEPGAPDSGENSEGRSTAEGGTVPDANSSNPAEDFRKRVLEGLGKGEGGRLAPAVRRYAEGLLR